MNEKLCIKRIQNGDHHALDIFIETLYPQVYTFIYRKVKGNDIAKDLTQEVFMRFMRALPTYQYQKKTMHYLYKISSHVCYSYFQKRKYDLEIEDEIVEDKSINVHEAIIKQFQADELECVIRQLKPKQQDVIILKYYHQYTFQEIADIYGENVSTIKSRHYQALVRLKKIMEGGYINEN